MEKWSLHGVGLYTEDKLRGDAILGTKKWSLYRSGPSHWLDCIYLLPNDWYVHYIFLIMLMYSIEIRYLHLMGTKQKASDYL